MIFLFIRHTDSSELRSYAEIKQSVFEAEGTDSEYVSSLSIPFRCICSKGSRSLVAGISILLLRLLFLAAPDKPDMKHLFVEVFRRLSSGLSFANCVSRKQDCTGSPFL